MDEWDFLFTKTYGNFGDIAKARPRSPITRWIITQSKSFY